ncbi:hypothetical protein JW698_01015 [Candidatus Wolfebacteria bacterium]|nr:hypothetical protein [Candidatus Wolfebacteria bacterium]
MISNFYSKTPKRIKLLILFIIIILIAYFVLRFLAIDLKEVPEEFLIARQEASIIASEIVAISSQSAGNFKEIARLDGEKKYNEALDLISQELERNKQAREKAIELSLQLEIMTNNLSQIFPSSASQIALGAITSETTLISRLITYNDYLNQLLEILGDKFLGNGNGDKIMELIEKINEEARAINELNDKFNEAMKEFDSN